MWFISTIHNTNSLTACTSPEVEESINNGWILKHDVINMAKFLKSKWQTIFFNNNYRIVSPKNQLKVLKDFLNETICKEHDICQ